jgi:hypothetical protein
MTRIGSDVRFGGLRAFGKIYYFPTYLRDPVRIFVVSRTKGPEPRF